MKTISLTRGKVALVDDDVYEWASKFKWLALKTGRRWYAIRSERKLTLLLHREILESPKGVYTDHINGDGLDNRRENLRICTRQQNAQGFQRKQVGTTSKFRGVSRCRGQKWQSHIKANGHKHYLGQFKSEEDAARAYDVAAKELFGEFASPNFIGASPTIPGAWVLCCRAIRLLDALPDPV